MAHKARARAVIAERPPVDMVAFLEAWGLEDVGVEFKAPKPEPVGLDVTPPEAAFGLAMGMKR